MMLKPRVLVAGLYHETHTFLQGETTLLDCDIAVGEELLRANGDASPLGSALEVALEMGWEVIPAIDIRAIPGPICADEIVDLWWRQVELQLQESKNGQKLDAVFLVLHGAMVSRSLDDVEGEILQRVRSIIGPEIPIGGVTDLHANFSERMAQNSNCLVTYRENPHSDARDTAKRAALLLDFLLHCDEYAVTYFRQVPVLWPPTGTATKDCPMRGLEALARKIEKGDAEILAVNVHAGYSFSDVADAGVSFTVVSVGDSATAQKALDKLESLAIESSEEGNVIEPSFDDLLPEIRNLLRLSEGGAVVLAEPSDNIGGGAAGDGTGLLQELLKHQIGRSVVIIADAKAVLKLHSIPVGTKSRLKFGNATGFNGAEPVELEIELLSISDGKFELEDSQSHLASMMGMHIDMGPCATLRHDLQNGEGLLILLTSRPTPPFDLGQLRSQGIEPEFLQVIGVKAAVAHRRAYEPIARALLSVATSGPCASDLKTLPFKRVRRPIFPLDAI
jgi:microcystin degradation protein MlrC